MKLLAYCLSLSILFLPTIAYPQPLPSRFTTTEKAAIPHFSHLIVQGPINIYINATQATPSLQILRNSKTTSQLIWRIKDDTLYLIATQNNPLYRANHSTVRLNTTPAQLRSIYFDSAGNLLGEGLTGTLSLSAKKMACVSLYSHQLNLKSLYADGNTRIIIHNIRSSRLNIKVRGNNNIRLEGEAALHTIDSNDNGSLFIYWVNSPYLKVNALGQEKIFLAGTAHTLDAELGQKATLFSKQLRTNEGFIKTQDQAQAQVTVKNKLYAFAKDHSIIDYTRPVCFISAYTLKTGLVLSH